MYQIHSGSHIWFSIDAKKLIADVLQGRVRAGLIAGRGSKGKMQRYVLVSEQA